MRKDKFERAIRKMRFSVEAEGRSLYNRLFRSSQSLDSNDSSSESGERALAGDARSAQQAVTLMAQAMDLSHHTLRSVAGVSAVRDVIANPTRQQKNLAVRKHEEIKSTAALSHFALELFYATMSSDERNAYLIDEYIIDASGKLHADKGHAPQFMAYLLYAQHVSRTYTYVEDYRQMANQHRANRDRFKTEQIKKAKSVHLKGASAGLKSDVVKDGAKPFAAINSDFNVDDHVIDEAIKHIQNLYSNHCGDRPVIDNQLNLNFLQTLLNLLAAVDILNSRSQLYRKSSDVRERLRQSVIGLRPDLAEVADWKEQFTRSLWSEVERFYQCECDVHFQVMRGEGDSKGVIDVYEAYLRDACVATLEHRQQAFINHYRDQYKAWLKTKNPAEIEKAAARYYAALQLFFNERRAEELTESPELKKFFQQHPREYVALDECRWRQGQQEYSLTLGENPGDESREHDLLIKLLTGAETTPQKQTVMQNWAHRQLNLLAVRNHDRTVAGSINPYCDDNVILANNDWVVRNASVWSYSYTAAIQRYVDNALHYALQYPRNRTHAIARYRLAHMQQILGYMPDQYIDSAKKYKVNVFSGISEGEQRKGELRMAHDAFIPQGVTQQKRDALSRDRKFEIEAGRELREDYLEQQLATCQRFNQMGEYACETLSTLSLRFVELHEMYQSICTGIARGQIIGEYQEAQRLIEHELQQVVLASSMSYLHLNRLQQQDTGHYKQHQYNPFADYEREGPHTTIFVERPEIAATLTMGVSTHLSETGVSTINLGIEGVRLEKVQLPTLNQDYLENRTNLLVPLRVSEPDIMNRYAGFSQNPDSPFVPVYQRLSAQEQTSVTPPHWHLHFLMQAMMAAIPGRELVMEQLLKFYPDFNKELANIDPERSVDTGNFRLPLHYVILGERGYFLPYQQNCAHLADEAERATALRACLEACAETLREQYTDFCEQHLADLISLSYHVADVHQLRATCVHLQRNRQGFSCDRLVREQRYSLFKDGTRRAMRMRYLLEKAQAQIQQQPQNSLLQQLNALIEAKFSDSKADIQQIADFHRWLLTNEYQDRLGNLQYADLLNAENYNVFLDNLSWLDPQGYAAFISDPQFSMVRYFEAALNAQRFLKEPHSLPALELDENINISYITKLRDNCIAVLQRHGERDIAQTQIDAINLISGLMLRDETVYARFTEEGKANFQAWLANQQTPDAAFSAAERTAGNIYYQLACAIERICPRSDQQSAREYFKLRLMPEVLRGLIPADCPLITAVEQGDFVAERRATLKVTAIQIIERLTSYVFNINRPVDDSNPEYALNTTPKLSCDHEMNSYNSCIKAVDWLECLSRDSGYNNILLDDDVAQQMRNLYTHMSNYIVMHGIPVAPPEFSQLVATMCATFRNMGDHYELLFDDAIVGSLLTRIDSLPLSEIGLANSNVRLLLMVTTPKQKQHFLMTHYLRRIFNTPEATPEDPSQAFVNVVQQFLWAIKRGREADNDELGIQFIQRALSEPGVHPTPENPDESRTRHLQTIRFIYDNIDNSPDEFSRRYHDWNEAHKKANETWDAICHAVNHGEPFDAIQMTRSACQSLRHLGCGGDAITHYKDKLAQRVREMPHCWLGCEQEMGIIPVNNTAGDWSPFYDKWIHSICCYPDFQVSYSGEVAILSEGVDHDMPRYLSNHVKSRDDLIRIFGEGEPKQLTSASYAALRSLKTQVEQCAARGEWQGRNSLIVLAKRFLSSQPADGSVSILARAGLYPELLMDDSFLQGCEEAQSYLENEVMLSSQEGSVTDASLLLSEGGEQLRPYFVQLDKFLNRGNGERKARIASISKQRDKLHVLRYQLALCEDVVLHRLTDEANTNRQAAAKVRKKTALLSVAKHAKQVRLHDLNAEYAQQSLDYETRRSDIRQTYADVVGSYSCLQRLVGQHAEQGLNAAELRARIAELQVSIATAEQDLSLLQTMLARLEHEMFMFLKEPDARIDDCETLLQRLLARELQGGVTIQGLLDQLELNTLVAPRFQALNSEFKLLSSIINKAKVIRADRQGNSLSGRVAILLTDLSRYNGGSITVEPEIMALIVLSEQGDTIQSYAAREVIRESVTKILSQQEHYAGIRIPSHTRKLFQAMLEMVNATPAYKGAMRLADLQPQLKVIGDYHNGIGREAQQRYTAVRNDLAVSRVDRQPLPSDVNKFYAAIADERPLIAEQDILRRFEMAKSVDVENAAEAFIPSANVLEARQRQQLQAEVLQKVSMYNTAIMQARALLVSLGIGAEVRVNQVDDEFMLANPNIAERLTVAQLQALITVAGSEMYTEQQFAQEGGYHKLLPQCQPSPDVVNNPEQWHQIMVALSSAKAGRNPEHYANAVAALGGSLDGDLRRRIADAFAQAFTQADADKAQQDIQTRVAPEQYRQYVTAQQDTMHKQQINIAFTELLTRLAFSDGSDYIYSYQTEAQLMGLVNAFVQENGPIAEKYDMQVRDLIHHLALHTDMKYYLMLSEGGIAVLDHQFMLLRTIAQVSDGRYDQDVQLLEQRFHNIKAIADMRIILGYDKMPSEQVVTETIAAVTQQATQELYTAYLQNDCANALNQILRVLAMIRDVLGDKVVEVRSGDQVIEHNLKITLSELCQAMLFPNDMTPARCALHYLRNQYYHELSELLDSDPRKRDPQTRRNYNAVFGLVRQIREVLIPSFVTKNHLLNPDRAQQELYDMMAGALAAIRAEIGDGCPDVFSATAQALQGEDATNLDRDIRNFLANYIEIDITGIFKAKQDPRFNMAGGRSVQHANEILPHVKRYYACGERLRRIHDAQATNDNLTNQLKQNDNWYLLGLDWLLSGAILQPEAQQAMLQYVIEGMQTGLIAEENVLNTVKRVVTLRGATDLDGLLSQLHSIKQGLVEAEPYDADQALRDMLDPDAGRVGQFGYLADAEAYCVATQYSHQFTEWCYNLVDAITQGDSAKIQLLRDSAPQGESSGLSLDDKQALLRKLNRILRPNPNSAGRLMRSISFQNVRLPDVVKLTLERLYSQLQAAVDEVADAQAVLASAMGTANEAQARQQLETSLAAVDGRDSDEIIYEVSRLLDSVRQLTDEDIDGPRLQTHDADAAEAAAPALPVYQQDSFVQAINLSLNLVNNGYKYFQNLTVYTSEQLEHKKAKDTLDNCAFREEAEGGRFEVEFWMHKDNDDKLQKEGVFSTFIKYGSQTDPGARVKLKLSIALQAKLRLLQQKISNYHTTVNDAEASIWLAAAFKTAVELSALINYTEQSIQKYQKSCDNNGDITGYLRASKNIGIIRPLLALSQDLPAESRVVFYGRYHREILYPLIVGLAPQLRLFEAYCVAQGVEHPELDSLPAPSTPDISLLDMSSASAGRSRTHSVVSGVSMFGSPAAQQQMSTPLRPDEASSGQLLPPLPLSPVEDRDDSPDSQASSNAAGQLDRSTYKHGVTFLAYMQGGRKSSRGSLYAEGARLFSAAQQDGEEQQQQDAPRRMRVARRAQNHLLHVHS